MNARLVTPLTRPLPGHLESPMNHPASSPNRAATLAAFLLATLLLAGGEAAAQSDGGVSPPAVGALLRAQVIETRDQDFERDRACLRNTGGEGVWKDAGHALGFAIPHGLKQPPGPQDVRVSPPAGLELATLEVQDQVVIITLVPGPEGYTFLAGGLTCIDLVGLDYREDLPQGWFTKGLGPARPDTAD